MSLSRGIMGRGDMADLYKAEIVREILCVRYRERKQSSVSRMSIILGTSDPSLSLSAIFFVGGRGAVVILAGDDTFLLVLPFVKKYDPSPH